MKGAVSFVMLEKKMMHEMRNEINKAEDTADLLKQFSNSMKRLLSDVFEQRHLPVNVYDGDVIFDPDEGGYYRISEELKRADGVRELFDSSDLTSIIRKFAASVHRKYLHLTRHREKARFKIR